MAKGPILHSQPSHPLLDPPPDYTGSSTIFCNLSLNFIFILFLKISASERSTLIPCPSSFLFSLHNPKGFAPKKIYPHPSNGEDLVAGGIRCGSSVGPAFGSNEGCDISTLLAEKNRRFGVASFLFGFGASLKNEYLFVGRREFLTTDLEVFGLPQ